MTSRSFAIAAALALLGPAVAGAAAENDDAFWVGPAAFVCMTQDASLKSSTLGVAMTRNGVYDNWRASEGGPALDCIASRRLLPDSLCAALFRMDANGDPGLVRSLHAQYADSIDGLQRIGECDSAGR